MGKQGNGQRPKRCQYTSTHHVLVPRKVESWARAGDARAARVRGRVHLLIEGMM